MKRFPIYEEIKQHSTHIKTKQLIDYILEKKSNLCCAADVLSAKDLLELAEEIGEHIVLLKIHVDTLPDFSIGFLYKLQEIAKKHKFLIFEDRKIADIGFVAQQQLLSGVYKIANQADLVTVHAIAGESSIKALKEAGKSCGIILVCEMSTNDTLTKVSIKNPYYITMDKQDDIREKHAKDTSYFIKMRNDLIDKGYDSLFVKERFTKISNWDVRDPNIIAVFNIEDVEIL